MLLLQVWAFVYVQNPTGGVFEGDHLITSVIAQAGARVHLTTQSATKLYRTENAPARQELRFVLGAGAYVEHLPDRSFHTPDRGSPRL